MDLGASVCQSPEQAAELTGIEAVRELQKEGLVGAALVNRVQEEGTALLERLRQESVPRNR